MSKTYDAFISYANENKNVAFAIVNRMETQGIRCFIAPRDIETGRDYATAIIDAIEMSKVTVLIFSTLADQSIYVLREINSAVLRSKTIFPFRIEDVMPGKAMEFYLGVTHWLDAFPKILDKHIDALIIDVKQACAEPVVELSSPVVYTKPIMLDSDELIAIGYDMKRIVLETIEIDYQTVNKEAYIIDESIEGTVKDWLDDCTSYPDSFSLLVAKDVIVGYWRLSMINKENYQELICGEKIICPSMSDFYDFGGSFYAYIGLMPILPDFETSANYMLMLNKLFQRIVEMNQRGISVLEIGISVYTSLVEKIILKLGFEFKSINPAKGKIFSLTPNAIRTNEIFKTNYPEFYALYAKDNN